MKKTFFSFLYICLIAATAIAAPANAVVKGRVAVSDITVERLGSELRLTMELDLSGMHVGHDRQLTIIPMVHTADNSETLEFQRVTVAGRNMYYTAQRNHTVPSNFYKQGSVRKLRYVGMVADAAWVDGASLSVYYRVGGCCDATVDEGVDLIAPLRPNKVPEFRTSAFGYVAPVGDTVKVHEIKKTAYIDFPVNQVKIYPDYRRNSVELAKIQATIDSVRTDSDITITEVALKGFASPESSFEHNTALAIGRTNALKKYIQQLYHFPKDVISTSYEAEDWAGLRRFVAESNIDNRDHILAIIDSDLGPDAKEAKIKAEYPAQYRFMLDTWYPALRHTDYRIEYVIRQYTTLSEILAMLAKDPSKLSLSEFFRAAQSMTPGSPEFVAVMETAATIYPDKPLANLNAANAAMSVGDYDRAALYLGRIPDSDADAAVIYARGLLAAFSGDYESAEQLLSQAARLKVADAPAALEQVRRLRSLKDELSAPQGQRDFIIIE